MKIFTLLLITTLFYSCTKTTQNSDDQLIRNQEQSGTNPITTPDLPGGVIYPHSFDFKKSGLHGRIFKANKKACVECHGADLMGGESKVSCTSCHKTYPHSEDFAYTNLHGQEFLKNMTACQTCHGRDLLGGTSGGSCKECHDTYPHDLKFKSPKNHGKMWQSDKDSCASCHTEERINDTESALSCKRCHNFPHTEDFIDYEHGPIYLNNKSQCAGCHKIEDKPAGDQLSCNECHSYPHLGSWALPSNHGQGHLDAGDCADCHSPDNDFNERYPEKYIACNSCHIQLPHPKGFKYQHKKESVEVLGTCLSCHTDYTRNQSNSKGCLMCHRKKELKVRWEKLPEPIPPQARFQKTSVLRGKVKRVPASIKIMK